MSKNSARIREAIKALAHQPYEIRSGTVVPGSVDLTSYTMSVRPTEGGKAIGNVLLNSTRSNANGVIVIPTDNSDVIIGTVDGPGEWVLLRTGAIEKVLVKIGNVNCVIDGTKATIKNGSVVFDVGASKFKMKTGSESLYDILHDLLNALKVMKYDAFEAPPLNAAAYTALLLRLELLLSN